jgi:hypothetical protein
VKRTQVGVTEAGRETIVQAGAGVGALLIVLSLFLPWFSLGLSDSAKALAETGVQQQIDAVEEVGGDAGATADLIDTSVTYSGWSSLELADALLLLVAIGAALFTLRRRQGDASAAPREGDDRLMKLGLIATVVVLVLLFTKNSVLGMIGSTVDFAQDKASDLGVPGGSQLDVLAISPGLGLWLGLLGALLILVAGYFHSLVDPTGVAQPASAPAPTQVAPVQAPPPTAGQPAPPADSPAPPPQQPPGVNPPGSA